MLLLFLFRINPQPDQFASLNQDKSIDEEDERDEELQQLSEKSEDEEERIKLLSEHPLVSVVRPDKMPSFDRNQLLSDHMV